MTRPTPEHLAAYARLIARYEGELDRLWDQWRLPRKQRTPPPTDWPNERYSAVKWRLKRIQLLRQGRDLDVLVRFTNRHDQRCFCTPVNPKEGAPLPDPLRVHDFPDWHPRQPVNPGGGGRSLVLRLAKRTGHSPSVIRDALTTCPVGTSPLYHVKAVLGEHASAS